MTLRHLSTDNQKTTKTQNLPAPGPQKESAFSQQTLSKLGLMNIFCKVGQVALSHTRLHLRSFGVFFFSLQASRQWRSILFLHTPKNKTSIEALRHGVHGLFQMIPKNLPFFQDPQPSKRHSTFSFSDFSTSRTTTHDTPNKKKPDNKTRRDDFHR
jgi:hypothetical protein